MKENRSVLTFDGEGDYITIERKPAHKNLKQLTLEAWVKVAPDGQYEEFAGIVTNLVDNDDEESGFTLCLNGSGGVYFGLKPAEPGEPLRMFPDEDATDFVDVNFKEEEWHHVAGVYDGAHMILYIDGEEKARQALVTDHILSEPDNDLHIGATKDANDTIGFQGQIAQVSVWNTPRSKAEVQHDMHNRLKGDEPGLTGYWPMDEGEGQTINGKPGGQTGSIHGDAKWGDSEVPFPETMGPDKSDEGSGDGIGTGTGTKTTTTTTTTTKTGTTTIATTTGTGGGLTTTTGGAGTNGRDGVTTSHSTSTALVAATQHLNRQSMVLLLQRIVKEIDDHCKNAGEVDGKLSKQREDYQKLINELKETNHTQDKHIADIETKLTELRNSVKNTSGGIGQEVQKIVTTQITGNKTQLIKEIKEQLREVISKQVSEHLKDGATKDLQAKLNNMMKLLENVKTAAHELDEREVDEVREVLTKVIEHLDFSKTIEKANITVNGKAFNLKELLELLAGSEKVAAVKMAYGPDDLNGCTYVLTDKSSVVFTCTRSIGPGGGVHYVFETSDWKGVPASFTLGFRKNSTEMSMCRQTLALDSYDVDYETNLVFDLSPNGGRAARDIKVS